MIGSVLKAIEIMETFTSDQPVLTLNEISKKLEYPKTTVYTILNTLESKGLIERGSEGIYSLGTAIIPMTQAIRVNVQLRDRAAPLLRELGDYCKESVYLTVLEDPYCLYIYAIESPDRLLARTAVGDKMPMHCTSVGKAILAYLPRERVESILKTSGLEKFNENTITELPQLFEELEATRARGYSLDRAEHEMETYCLGAPIFDDKGQVFASCSVAGADNAIIGDKMEAFSAGLRYTAQEISRRMGFVPKAETLIWRETSNPIRTESRN